MRDKVKILQIGNYPPPMCGWAIQTSLVTGELRKRGYVCDVLKINEGRQIKDPSYVDVQNVFNSQNPEGVTYDYRYDQSAYIRGLPILPIAGVRGRF